jgi:uncharacterized protein (TIGR02996 family)
MTVRLEFKEGTSNKFWELDLDGSAYTLRWGRIGSSGQEKSFTFPSTLKAKSEADKLIAEKKKKGYEEIAAAGGAKKKAAKKKPAVEYKRNPSLEKLIAKNLSDPTNYLVYGDWLTAEGDPRGELVTVQHSISELSNADKKGAKGKALISREKSILKANANFVGDAVPPQLAKIGWRWGFIESLKFNNDEDWMDDNDKVDVPGMVKALLASPAIAGISSIEINILRWDDVYKDATTILKAFGESPYGKQITKVVVAPPSGDVDTGMFDPGKSTENLAKWFPNLEVLKIHGNDFKLGPMNFPKLRELYIETCGLDKKMLAQITSGTWPKVERAEIWFGSDDYGCNCKVKDLQPIFDGKVFPKVENLGLMNSEFADAIAKEIINSKVIKKLKILNLSLGTIWTEGVKAFLENPKAIAHLDSINVNDNHISKKDLIALRKLNKPVFVSREQKDVDDDGDGEIYRYVSVAE